MNILIVTQSYRPQNGQGVFAAQLAQGLACRGNNTWVIKPSDQMRGYREEEGSLKIENIFAIPLSPFAEDVYVTPFPARPLDLFMNENQPDVIHLQDHYPLCRAVVKTAQERKIPVMGTNHFLPDNMAPYIPLVSKFEAGRELVRRILWRQVMAVFHQLDLVTAPTKTAAEILRRNGLEGSVIPVSNGVNLKRFQPDPKVDRIQMRVSYGLDPERFLFLYVGRIDLEKELEVLIDAFRILNRNDLQLGLVGSGNHEEFLREQVKEHSLERKVVFCGFVPDEDLPALLNSGDAFCIPSESELQSIATLEAMGTGLPVLAADARALPELVHHGVNGYLFHPGDPQDAARYMKEMVDQPERLVEMGQASLDIVAPHALDNTIDRFLTLYRKLQAGLPDFSGESI